VRGFSTQTRSWRCRGGAEATRGLVERSTHAIELLSNYGEPHRPIGMASFASRGSDSVAGAAVWSTSVRGAAGELQSGGWRIR